MQPSSQSTPPLRPATSWKRKLGIALLSILVILCSCVGILAYIGGRLSPEEIAALHATSTARAISEAQAKRADAPPTATPKLNDAAAQANAETEVQQTPVQPTLSPTDLPTNTPQNTNTPEPTATPTPTPTKEPTTTPTLPPAKATAQARAQLKATDVALDQNYPEVDIRDLVKSPERYRDQKLQIKGTVFNIREETGFIEGMLGEGPTTFMQIWVQVPGGNEFDNEAVSVRFKGTLEDVYKDSYVWVYGIGDGVFEGTNRMGATIQQPLIRGEWISWSTKEG